MLAVVELDTPEPVDPPALEVEPAGRPEVFEPGGFPDVPCPLDPALPDPDGPTGEPVVVDSEPVSAVVDLFGSESVSAAADVTESEAGLVVVDPADPWPEGLGVFLELFGVGALLDPGWLFVGEGGEGLGEEVDEASESVFD